MPLSGAVTYYVANSASGGSDLDGDGSEATPYLTIRNAVEQAQAADADSLTIILLSDIQSTQEIAFNDPDMSILITSDDDYTVQFAGTQPIGLASGFIKVTDGADVTFDGVNLAGSTGTFDGRVIYVADGGMATLQDLTVSDGRTLNAIQNNEHRQ